MTFKGKACLLRGDRKQSNNFYSLASVEVGKVDSLSPRSRDGDTNKLAVVQPRVVEMRW